jgi:hypothetical protein
VRALAWRALALCSVCAVTQASDWAEPLNRIRLDKSGDVYLSLGGELRERYEYYREPLFGIRGLARDDYLLHRLLLGFDLHAGDSFRFYLQLGSHFEAGKRAPRGPTDLDALDLQQAYIDVSIPLNVRARSTFRAGRQELSFGSARLVGVRDGPNVRRSFDGARITVAHSVASSSLDVFVVRPVSLLEGTFDDEPAPDEAFWGVYGVLPLGAVADGHVDLYYLGLERDDAAFQQGEADEHRHSFGARVWGAPAGFDYNFEAVVQTGSFGEATILAWTVASDTGYTFKSGPFTPRVGLKADIASGDSDPRDRRLGTFNALFPKQPYFSEASLLAPANLIDLHPSATLHLTEKCSFTTDVDFFWKHEVDDSIYSPPGRPLIRAGQSDARFTGTQVNAALDWELNKHLSIGLYYSRFIAGPAVTQAGGKSVDFVGSWITFQF